MDRNFIMYMGVVFLLIVFISVLVAKDNDKCRAVGGVPTKYGCAKQEYFIKDYNHD